MTTSRDADPDPIPPSTPRADAEIWTDVCVPIPDVDSWARKFPSESVEPEDGVRMPAEADSATAAPATATPARVTRAMMPAEVPADTRPGAADTTRSSAAA